MCIVTHSVESKESKRAFSQDCLTKMPFVLHIFIVEITNLHLHRRGMQNYRNLLMCQDRLDR